MQPDYDYSVIEFGEICSLCDNEIPNGSLVLRHTDTTNILCLICLVKIAEVNE